MRPEVAVAVAVSEVVPRRSLRRKPLSYLAWMVMGGVATYVDKIHEYLGVVAYPDKEWIGEKLPVSPVYVVAAVGFFALYSLIVGHRGRAQGLFGGRPLTTLDFVYGYGSWIVAYTLSGLLASSGRHGGHWPWVGGAVLLGWALIDLVHLRRTWLPLYAAVVAVLGVAFEGSATYAGAFVYPVCPSSECLGTTVPAAWLFPLYLHAGLFIHRMMGGRHALSRYTSDHGHEEPRL